MEKGLQHEHIDVEERSSGVKKGGGSRTRKSGYPKSTIKLGGSRANIA